MSSAESHGFDVIDAHQHVGLLSNAGDFGSSPSPAAPGDTERVELVKRLAGLHARGTEEDVAV